jgi:hypothetical protein
MNKPERKPHRRLQACKAWKQGLPMPEIVFYTEENFGGEHYRTNCDVEFIGDYIPTVIHENEVKTTDINDHIKSIVVVSGEWQLYKDAGFRVKIGKILGIGFHETIDEGKGVSSAKCIRC